MRPRSLQTFFRTLTTQPCKKPLIKPTTSVNDIKSVESDPRLGAGFFAVGTMVGVTLATGYFIHHFEDALSR